MSRIDKLIADLCPDGVSHYQLGEIAGYSDTRAQASHLDKTTFVGVDNLLPNKGGRVDASHTPNTSSLTAYEAGDLLLGNIRPYLKKIWLSDRTGGCSGDVLTIRLSKAFHPLVDARFLYYTLSSDKFFSYATQHSKGAKMPRGDKAAILNFRVPVPPLEAQREIVRVLDKFTQLEAELEAELEARRRQYEHYRSALLSFPAGDAKSSTLGELAVRVSSGGTPHSGTPEYYESGNIPWLRSQDINGSRVFHTGAMITKEGLLNSSARWIPKNCVIVAMYGATAARVAINEIPLTTNQACCNIELDSSKADYRYVFFWIANQYETLKALGEGSQSNLNSRKIKSFPILVPPLEEQRRIVSILDRFDSLVNDLSIGLPAELAARRKQYEYYRDRLLTFEEKR